MLNNDEARVSRTLRHASGLPKRRRRVAQFNISNLQLFVLFSVPAAIIAITAYVWQSDLPTDKDAGVFTGLLGVHATIAGLAVVAFVFLLQTANFSRRRKSVMLALAKKAGILQATAYSLGTLVGGTFALIICREHQNYNAPIHRVVVAGLISSVVWTFIALLRGASSLGKKYSQTSKTRH